MEIKWNLNFCTNLRQIGQKDEISPLRRIFLWLFPSFYTQISYLDHWRIQFKLNQITIKCTKVLKKFFKLFKLKENPEGMISFPLSINVEIGSQFASFELNWRWFITMLSADWQRSRFRAMVGQQIVPNSDSILSAVR